MILKTEFNQQFEDHLCSPYFRLHLCTKVIGFHVVSTVSVTSSSLHHANPVNHKQVGIFFGEGFSPSHMCWSGRVNTPTLPTSGKTEQPQYFSRMQKNDRESVNVLDFLLQTIQLEQSLTECLMLSTLYSMKQLHHSRRRSSNYNHLRDCSTTS